MDGSGSLIVLLLDTRQQFHIAGKQCAAVSPDIS